jgi:hypothetical protein
MSERMNESLIRPRLWLGSWKDAERILELAAQPKHRDHPDRSEAQKFIIVTVAWDSPVVGDFEYRLNDPGYGADQPGLLAAAADKVIELLQTTPTNNQILVHCYSGINRSASVVIAVLMKLDGLTLLEAYNKVIAVRPFVHPFPQHLQAALQYAESTEVLDVNKLPNYGGNK